MNTILDSLRGKIGSVRFLIRDFVLYSKHKAMKTSYADYYADRMNRHIKKNPGWGLNIDRIFQLNYLSQHGLRPSSTFLDYGCGALAAGIHFINYLEPGKYVGCDVSKGVLAEGNSRIQRLGLNSKNPEVIHVPGGDLRTLPNRAFDMIWAYSVLTHMPPQDIQNLFFSLRKIMGLNTVFFATFARSDDIVYQKRFKDWYYPLDIFSKMARKAGFAIQVMEDWKSSEDYEGRDTLARLAIKE